MSFSPQYRWWFGNSFNFCIIHKFACQTTLFDGKGTTIKWINENHIFFFRFYFQLMFSLLQFNHCVFFMCNLSAFKMLQHNYTYYEKSIQGSWCSNCWFRFYRKSGIIVKTKAMHTALEMKGISTKTICTACYHLTIVVFCTIKEESVN